MESEVSFPLLQKQATCHYNQQSCVAATKNGAFSVFTSVRTKFDVIVHDIETH